MTTATEIFSNGMAIWRKVYDFHTTWCIIFIQTPIHPWETVAADVSDYYLCIVKTKMMMKRTLHVILLSMICIGVWAQERWTADRCMQYAAVHGHEVRQQMYALDDSRSDQVKAIGEFMPSIEASTGGRYNFGRAINPETNTYTNVSTFYNNYGISASIPVFDGFCRYHELCMAKANVLMGKHALQAKKDETAMRVFKAYIDVCYYQETLVMAQNKREESAMLLHQTRVMAEVGTKGEADVAQMEATHASDDYEVTRQQSLLTNAMLALKGEMNYPADSLLALEPPATEVSIGCMPGITDVYGYANATNPKIKQAEYNVLAARQSLSAARGKLFPSISIGAGISTSYYKTLHRENTASFSSQFRNNAGQYVYASLNIPIFNRLATVSNIRRQRNNLRRAVDNLDHERTELRRLITEAATDCANSRSELVKMERKVAADSIAARLCIRKYEEGLASPVDVQTTAVALLQSRVQMLQSRLTYIYKNRLLNYYQGQPLWTDQ